MAQFLIPLIQTGLQAYQAYTTTTAEPGRAPSPATGPQLPGVPLVEPAVLPMMGGVGGAMGMVGPMVARAAPTLARLAPRFLALVKLIGLEAAAGAIGLTIAQAAQVLFIGLRRRRRRRGISAADIRRTRRTIRTIGNIQCDLGLLRGGGGIRRRCRRTCK